MRTLLTAIFVASWLTCAGNAGAALMSIEAVYDAPGANGTTVSITGIYDDTGFTGSGFEDFVFVGEVNLVFAPNENNAPAGGSFLAGSNHTVNDMFGIRFFNGAPNDLINNNNLLANGNSRLIFNSVLDPIQGYGIWLADNSTALHVEAWSVVNHQTGQQHSLDVNGFNGPQPIPLPPAAALVLIPLLLLRRRRNASHNALI